MSRRASVFARQNPGKRRVRFPDEVIFENEIKEQDGDAVMHMLRRASIDIDINRINSAGKPHYSIFKSESQESNFLITAEKFCIENLI